MDSSATIDSETHLRAELEELRHSLLTTLMLIVPLLSWCWFLAALLRNREIGPANIPPAVFGLSMYLVHRLRRRHHRLACWAFLLALILGESSLVLVHPSLTVVSFGVLAIVVANALLGGHGALATALAMWGATTASGLWATRHAAPRWDPLEALLLYLLTWGVAWLASRPLQTSIAWALSGWRRATEALSETRERRGELYRALRALEEASYRIERMNSELVLARREAEEARALKARFAAEVSHELRGPLSLVLGFSQMIALSPERYGASLPKAYQADVDAIYRNSQHLVALVDDVLDLSRIEAERLPLVKDRVDLVDDVLRKVVTIVEPLAHRKGLYLQLEAPGELPWILADPIRLRQALLNLVTNAVRFTDEGGITLRAGQHDDGLVITVEDTGPGIAPEEMGKLFREFSQVGGSETREAAGTGLGLSISKHLIELHGGRIEVDSTPGMGSRFTLSLPLPGADRASIDFVRTEPVRHRLGTESCLIVHDDPGIVRLLARHIEDYYVVGLPNEREVVALTQHLHPRAIITTPETGESVLGALSSAAYDVPVVTCGLPRLSGWTGITGVLGYLIKPVSADMVMALMRRAERNGETTILLVDDDPDAVRLLERMLTAISRPYNILRAYDGLEALKVMEATVPDVVFIDLLMPSLDGKQTIMHMRRDERLRDVAVVIVSARDWLEGEAVVGTPISVHSRAPVEVARAARCLKALLDALGPKYLPDNR